VCMQVLFPAESGYRRLFSSSPTNSYAIITMDFGHGTVLWKLRNEALQFNEFSTTKLWVYILNKCLFTNPDYVVSSEEPPSKHESLKRIGIMVEQYDCDNDVFELKILLLAENNHDLATASIITTLEQQIHSRCREFLEVSKREAVWAVSAYGPYARLWLCSKADMYSVYPRDKQKNSRDLYRDIKYHSEAFLQYFSAISDIHLPKVDSVQMVHDYIDEDVVMASEVPGPLSHANPEFITEDSGVGPSTASGSTEIGPQLQSHCP
jgi:hypothetical protein